LTLALSVLLVVLVVVAIGTLGVLVWALLRAVDTMTSVKRLADDTDRELMPLVAKADATLDAVNAELERVEVIVDQVQDVAETVTETRRAAQDAADKAVVKVVRFGRAVGEVLKPSVRATDRTARQPAEGETE
jgi:uncharacterized protein YoxC